MGFRISFYGQRIFEEFLVIPPRYFNSVKSIYPNFNNITIINNKKPKFIKLKSDLVKLSLNNRLTDNIFRNEILFSSKYLYLTCDLLVVCVLYLCNIININDIQRGIQNSYDNLSGIRKILNFHKATPELPEKGPVIFFEIERKKNNRWTNNCDSRSKHTGIILTDSNGQRHAYGIGPPQPHTSNEYFRPKNRNDWSPFEHDLPISNEKIEIMYLPFNQVKT